MDHERVWLVQRLQKPHHFVIKGKKVDNPFNFGGGYKNGGLTNDAMDILREIFSFDYMGAAEFEWGAVPKALAKMAGDRKDFKKFTIILKSGEIEEPWRNKKGVKFPGPFKVFSFCREGDAKEVEKFIRKNAKNKTRLKEMTMLNHALKPIEKWDSDRCGWLELGSGFFFFTDEEMCDKTVAMFSDVPSDVKAKA